MNCISSWLAAFSKSFYCRAQSAGSPLTVKSFSQGLAMSYWFTATGCTWLFTMQGHTLGLSVLHVWVLFHTPDEHIQPKVGNPFEWRLDRWNYCVCKPMLFIILSRVCVFAAAALCKADCVYTPPWVHRSSGVTETSSRMSMLEHNTIILSWMKFHLLFLNWACPPVCVYVHLSVFTFTCPPLLTCYTAKTFWSSCLIGQRLN